MGDDGSVMGRIKAAARGHQLPSWWSWPVAPMALTVLACLLGYLQKVPCQRGSWLWDRHQIFDEYCYSDMSLLFRERGLIDGVFPYAPGPWEHEMEYPVITGYVMDLTARITRLIAGDDGEGALMRTYFAVNVVLLMLLAMLTVWLSGRLLIRLGQPVTPVYLIAGAPVLVLAGTINWDLVAVALTGLALLTWIYERPWLAGAMIGLGTAAKLYPALLIGPLAVLGLRNRQLRPVLAATGAAIVAWVATNLPVLLLYPEGWLVFWRFNADRAADYGSFWYAMMLLDQPVPALNVLAPALLLACCAGIAALAWWAPRPPSVAQVSFLIVAAFLVTNKVYSPQYVLWLLPLVALARAGTVGWRSALRDWAIWQAAEVLYWVMVWRYLTGLPDDDAWQYPVSVFLRIAVELYLVGQVVADCFRPLPTEGRAEPAVAAQSGTATSAGPDCDNDHHVVDPATGAVQSGRA